MDWSNQNQGELSKLDVKIEKDVLDAFHRMAKFKRIPLEHLVVVAMKNFRARHCDFEGLEPHDQKTVFDDLD